MWKSGLLYHPFDITNGTWQGCPLIFKLKSDCTPMLGFCLLLTIWPHYLPFNPYWKMSAYSTYIKPTFPSHPCLTLVKLSTHSMAGLVCCSYCYWCNVGSYDLCAFFLCIFYYFSKKNKKCMVKKHCHLHAPVLICSALRLHYYM